MPFGISQHKIRQALSRCLGLFILIYKKRGCAVWDSSTVFFQYALGLKRLKPNQPNNMLFAFTNCRAELFTTCIELSLTKHILVVLNKFFKISRFLFAS